MTQMGKSHKMNASFLFGSLHLEELIDWIKELEDYFDLKDVKHQQKVRLAQTKLNGHATLWWKELQKERKDNSEPKITRWELWFQDLRPSSQDYELELFKKLQNLKKKDLIVKEYNEEFYKVTIISRL